MKHKIRDLEKTIILLKNNITRASWQLCEFNTQRIRTVTHAARGIPSYESNSTSLATDLSTDLSLGGNKTGNKSYPSQRASNLTESVSGDCHARFTLLNATANLKHWRQALEDDRTLRLNPFADI